MAGLNIGDAAPDRTIADCAGRPVRLGELWSRQPLVLVFLRHFG